MFSRSRAESNQSANATPRDPPRYSHLFSGVSEQEGSTIATVDSDWDARSITSIQTAFSATPTYHTSYPESVLTLSQPPQYGGSPVTLEGDFIYPIPKGVPESDQWALLRLPAKSSKGRTPLFLGGEDVSGTVELSIKSPQTIRTISLVLKGTLLTGTSRINSGSVRILQQFVPVWTREDGDPRNPHSSGSRFNGRFDSGDVVLPFTFTFPTHVDISTLAGVVIKNTVSSPVSAAPVGSQRWQVHPFPLDEMDSKGYPVEKRRDGVRPLTHPFNQDSHITPFNVYGGLPPASPSSQGAAFDSYNAPPSPLSPHPVPSSTSASSAPSKPRSRWSFISLKKAEKPSLGSPPLSPQVWSPRRNSVDEFDGMAGKVNEPNIYELPLGFVEKGIAVSVRYELTLLIQHGGLKTDSRATAPINFIPLTVPAPMPMNRQTAYLNHETLPTPSDDPTIWKKLNPVYLSDKRHVGCQCSYTFHLAEPLEYVPGTPLPCHLTITSCSSDTVDVPPVPQIRLIRSLMAYGHLKDTDTNIALSVGQSGMDEPALGIFMSTIPVVPTMSADKIIAAKVKAGKMTTIDTSQSDKGSARRAPTDNKEEDMRSSLDEEEPLKEVINCRTLWRQVHIPPTPQGGGKQVLEFRGEVQLPRNLKPTCTFPLLNLEYFIQLLGSPSLTPPAGEAEEIIHLSCPVKIAALPREDEPLPISLKDVRGDHA